MVQQVSISSMFYVQIFRTNAVLAAFSSYILALGRNLYEKFVRLTLMKLTTGHELICVASCRRSKTWRSVKFFRYFFPSKKNNGLQCFVSTFQILNLLAGPHTCSYMTFCYWKLLIA